MVFNPTLTHPKFLTNKAIRAYSCLQSVRTKIQNNHDSILLLEHFTHWLFKFRNSNKTTDNNDTTESPVETIPTDESTSDTLILNAEGNSFLIDQLLDVYHATKRKLTSEERFYLNQILQETEGK